MIYSEDCLFKYGKPAANNPWLVLWDIPTELEIGIIPKRIYCNKDLIVPLSKAFKTLIETGCVEELKTWDGCFNIRPIRGTSKSMSLHSWGIAVDMNAFENQLGQVSKFSSEFVHCFLDNGFDWGGNFSRLDPMHFQLRSI